MLKKFYGSTVWLRVRRVRLRMDEYMCRECKRYGKATQAILVHHIFPLDSFWKLRTNIHNLLSLCQNCHEKMHNRITDEVIGPGLSWQERMKSKLFG